MTEVFLALESVCIQTHANKDLKNKVCWMVGWSVVGTQVSNWLILSRTEEKVLFGFDYAGCKENCRGQNSKAQRWSSEVTWEQWPRIMVSWSVVLMLIEANVQGAIGLAVDREGRWESRWTSWVIFSTVSFYGGQMGEMKLCKTCSLLMFSWLILVGLYDKSISRCGSSNRNWTVSCTILFHQTAKQLWTCIPFHCSQVSLLSLSAT